MRMREGIPAAELEQFMEELGRHIHVDRRDRAVGEETLVRVDHRFPDLRRGHFKKREHWQVSTTGPSLKLQPKLYGRGASEVNRVGGQGRGRALYCYDLTLNKLLMAGVAYHVDRNARVPVQITALALPRRNNEEWRYNLFGVWLIKQYLHTLGGLLERGTSVICEENVAASQAELTVLGFRPAGRIDGLRPSSRLYVQDV